MQCWLVSFVDALFLLKLAQFVPAIVLVGFGGIRIFFAV